MLADGPTPGVVLLQGPLSDVIGGIIEISTLVQQYLLPSLTFIVTFLVVYAIGKLVAVPLFDRVLEERGFDPTVRSLAENVAGAAVVLVAAAIALTFAGFGSVIAAFGVFAGAIALAVGFASQELLSNFVAGIFILKDKPFEIGDWIECNGIEGRVEDIDLRVSRVRTFDNERITVPNADLANNALTNPVAYDKLREKFVFGVGYEDDLDHAKEVILDEARKNDGILDDPEPEVRVTELADSYVGLQSRFWIANPSRAEFVATRSDFVQSVKERCDAEGIELPYPYRQLTGDVGVEGDLRTEPLQQPADD
jgi:small-conductance mechanosensitive channel